MNKKSIIAISILALMLIVGIYYTVNDNDNNDKEKTSKEEEALIDENTEKSESVSEDEDIEEEDIEEVLLEKGKPAPDFTLKTLNGEDASLSDYKGKIVLINFWATWCKYCDEEMPDLEKLYNENKDDLVVLAVDVGEEEEKVRDYIEKGGYTFPVLLDKNSSIAQKNYYVSPYPTSYFIDEDGNLIGAVAGMMTYPQMTQILEQIKSGEI
ncbi:MAG: TlpA family protein disulfide reductase [Senegalia sp. (in: firmicutes)]|uniref:TlpA family protein disulfide reductase n=1 Tax=Senegalia sp. (in: firmicutes) TaxID=1924098 RepID=UPI003F9816CE